MPGWAFPPGDITQCDRMHLNSQNRNSQECSTDSVRVGCWLGSLTLSTRQPPPSKGPLWGRQATLTSLASPACAGTDAALGGSPGDGTQSRLHARQALYLWPTRPAPSILHYASALAVGSWWVRAEGVDSLKSQRKKQWEAGAICSSGFLSIPVVTRSAAVGWGVGGSASR